MMLSHKKYNNMQINKAIRRMMYKQKNNKKSHLFRKSPTNKNKNM